MRLADHIVKTVEGRGSKGFSFCILWPIGLNAGPVPNLGQQMPETSVSAVPADINVSIDDSPLRRRALECSLRQIPTV